MMDIFLEPVPERYDGDYPAVIIRYRPSEQDAARSIAYDIECIMERRGKKK